MNILDQYGFGGRFAAEAAAYPALFPARVLSQHGGLYKVITAEGELLAEVSGKFRSAAQRQTEYPVTGDFVLLDRANNTYGNGIIHHLMTRKSCFVRRAPEDAHNDTQAVAANIDTVFVCMALNSNYNLRRLERYLAVTWDSGAIPVVVLTKADLCEDAEQVIKDASAAAIGAAVYAVSSRDPLTYEPLRQYLKPGQTTAFIGSSGVGKSTLINCLVGRDVFATSGVRADGKGRHTTTGRELFLLPDGGVVMDTPGMRELGVESADLGKAFADIEALAEHCRFRDCSHGNEPGCAVQTALTRGELDSARLDSYFKLKKEARYDGLNSRQIESEKIRDMFSEFGGIKNAKRFVKEKQKQKPR